MITKKDIESMKVNREAFQFWPKEWQEWAVRNHTDFWVAKTGMKPHGSFNGTRAYQLDSDYQLPEPERWFFCNTNQELHKSFGTGEAFEEDPNWIEVPASLLGYVRECLKRDDIGEFELRNEVKQHEHYIVCESDGLPSCITSWNAGLGIRFNQPRFVRKAEPDLVPANTFAESFASLQKDIHQNAKDKGWHDSERNDGELIALMHSELSEALEAIREVNKPSTKIPGFSSLEEEISDVLIRAMDFAELRGLRLPQAMSAKHCYNKSRDHKHGGKKF